MIGFLASFLALQTSASRVIWSYARDGALPGSRVLSRLSTGARLPTAAILVTTVIGAALFLLSNVATNVYTLDGELHHRWLLPGLPVPPRRVPSSSS